MKKWLTYILYLNISFFAFADYFLTNGEVTFYYDSEEQAVSYLRGDALYPLDISRIRFYWIDEEERVYDLQNCVENIEQEGENILRLSYVLPEGRWKITFLPSFQKKHQLFCFFEGSLRRKGHFVVEISPQQENHYLRLQGSEGEKDLEYRNFLLSSNRKDFSIFLSKNSSLRDFHLEEILTSAKKFREDRLYYVFDKMKEGEERGILRFDFYQKETQAWKSFEEVQWEEKAAVLSSEQKYRTMRSSEILAKNLELLDLLSSRVYIPSSISYAKAKMSYLEKQQLLLLRALYDVVENHQRILEDVNLRKKELDSVYYFYYAFLYAEKTRRRIDQNLVEKRLSPQILSMYDEMTEDGRLIAVEDSLEAYASYYRLLSLLEKRMEFAQEREFIQERKEKLYSYIRKSFIKQGAFRDRSFLEKSNVKNIEYVFLLPSSMQRTEVKNWYDKNYDKTLGVFHYGKENSLDMLHNLKMVSVLYEVGMLQEAEQLLKHLESYIEKSQNFVLESYPLHYQWKKQELELSAQAMYYYLLANWNREQYHGNER
ncbi:hypothetical protein EPT55_03780 [Fusobacterium necrophorum]|uniref:hypothetical protein n=1 Tax=Fusobacterium necrophorum TaxID=859 RepID=UPI001010D71D|nr:hypothetical protein [Fusobacterium necrophorum]RXZ28123.1 hypothetical protein EPT55_03780 [Fusobacterium necrophorum]